MPPVAPRNNSLDEQLQRVHWHILRGDSLRAGVASRAGTLLSTNALVVAGIALAFGLKNHKPGVVVTILAIAALGCVAISVMHAALATMTIRSWRRQFPQHQEHGGSPYSLSKSTAVHRPSNSSSSGSPTRAPSRPSMTP